MKIQAATNDNIVIQARNEQDYEAAKKVAELMESENDWMVICSEDPAEYWIQLTSTWRQVQAKEFKEAYRLAKESV